MMNRTPLTLVSALNESGGGILHRLLDGHPAFYCYPFEIQLGTDDVADEFASWFKNKYRWPQFRRPISEVDPEAFFEAILDDEVKTYLKGRSTSKFAPFDLQLTSHDRLAAFLSRCEGEKASVGTYVEAYLMSLFDKWANRKVSGVENQILGHCPVLSVDSDRVFDDYGNAKVVHIYREPLPIFADTRRRISGFDVQYFCKAYNMVNGVAWYYAHKYPKQYHFVFYDDLLNKRTQTMTGICHFLGLDYDPILEIPTWNSVPIDGVRPFGGIARFCDDYDDELLKSVSAKDREYIERRTEYTATLLKELDR